MNKHQLRTKRKENDILLAAVELVGTMPLNELTIDKIKTKAKVSPMTIYKIFGSKENLIHEAIIKITKDRVILANEILNSNLPNNEKFKAYITNAFNTALQYPQQKYLRDYIFASDDEAFKSAVFYQYGLTMKPLEKLHSELVVEGVIRKEITFSNFIEFLDMITKTDSKYFNTEDKLNSILNGFIKFFG